MPGIEKIPLRVPADFESFVPWFEIFVREVLSKADVRNAVGNGIIITGQSDDFAELESSITGESGVLTVAVADNAITISVDDNGLTFSKIEQIPTETILGRVTAAEGDIEELTGTQATTLLNEFVGDSGSGGTKGLVPAPGTGDAGKYLDGDGTFTALPQAAAIADLNQTITDPPTQAEVQAISDKIDALLASLRSAGLLAT